MAVAHLFANAPIGFRGTGIGIAGINGVLHTVDTVGVIAIGALVAAVALVSGVAGAGVAFALGGACTVQAGVGGAHTIGDAGKVFRMIAFIADVAVATRIAVVTGALGLTVYHGAHAVDAGVFLAGIAFDALQTFGIIAGFAGFAMQAGIAHIANAGSGLGIGDNAAAVSAGPVYTGVCHTGGAPGNISGFAQAGSHSLINNAGTVTTAVNAVAGTFTAAVAATGDQQKHNGQRNRVH